MPHDIRALTSADLTDLSEFLREGFHAPPGSTFAAVDVLGWKYLDPRGADAGQAPRSLIARDPGTGSVIGHLGICPSRWRGGGLPPEGISTLHMMDWLSLQSHAGIGAALMRRAHQSTETQFGLGGSDAGRKVGGRGGYVVKQLVPGFQRVLRPFYRLRDSSQSPAGRALRAARDLLGRVRHRAQSPRVLVQPRAVEAFRHEVLPILQAYESRTVFTTREPDLLNHLLRFPRGGLTGWHLESAGGLIGFAILAVIPQSHGIKIGKIVDLILSESDDELWQASTVSLCRELKRQGADLAQAIGSTPWGARALRASGFAQTHQLEFRLRDRSDLLPRGVPFHLTPFESDYAYL